jgi:hypothetical protein
MDLFLKEQAHRLLHSRDRMASGAVDVPTELAFLNRLRRDEQRQQILGDLLNGVRRGVECADHLHVPARAWLADRAKWEVGSSGFPTATTRASILVARASTASKIDFGTLPASSMITRT